MDYDVIVLGGGAAGVAGAIKSAKAGLKVALFEPRDIGGTCLNRGCIPMKTLLRSAGFYRECKEASSLGVDLGGFYFREDAAYGRCSEVISAISNGLLSRLKSAGVEIFKSKGLLKKGLVVESEGTEFTTKNAIIATGSRPCGLNVPGFQFALSSDDVFETPVSASEIVIIGGGVIGIEMASYYADTNRKVTVIEFKERILPMYSKELAVQLALSLKRKNIDIITGASVTEIGENFVKYNKNGVESHIDCGAVIACAGRTGVTDGVFDRELGLRTERGFIVTEDHIKTGINGVYAAGDVTGKAMLAHYAENAGAACAEYITKGYTEIDLSLVPSGVYTTPQIAAVGIVSGEGIVSGKTLMGANGKSIVEGSDRGFVRIYADSSTGVICGGEILALSATELIAEIALAVKSGLKVSEIAGLIHAHPTLSEAVREAAEICLKNNF